MISAPAPLSALSLSVGASGPGDDPQRRDIDAVGQIAGHRGFAARVDDDTDRASVFEPGQTARQCRIVGENRADPGQNRIIFGPEQMPPAAAQQDL